jgi:membrane peptidoglycan carboxypeptidase
VAPWGDGQCGAHAAAKHFLNKSADQLSPMEAVWLATLLHNPDRELARLARDGQVNVQRVAWVADQLRPVARREREALLDAAQRWTPPRTALTSAMAVSASRAAAGR